LFLQGKLSLFPFKSLTQNFGDDGSGTNSGRPSSELQKMTSVYGVVISQDPVYITKIPVVENARAFKDFSRFFKSLGQEPFLQKIKRVISKKIIIVLKKVI